MSDVQELFTSKALSADATLVGDDLPCALGGIFCSTVTGSPTLQVTDFDGTVLVAAFVMQAGVYYPLPLRSPNGLKLDLTGTAAFTAFYIP